MVVTLLFKLVSQTTEPSGLMERTACPAGQIPLTRSCLLLTEVAVALKFWFTSAAVAGVPGTNVLRFCGVRSADHASDGVKTDALKARQAAVARRATLRIASMGSSKISGNKVSIPGPISCLAARHAGSSSGNYRE